jgi:hypothetical protein
MPLELEKNQNVTPEGEIVFYQKGIITKTAGASPSEFSQHLMRAAPKILQYCVDAAKNGQELEVITGFHGKDYPPGQFDRPFDQEDLGITRAEFLKFASYSQQMGGKIKLTLLSNGISDDEIIKKVENGHVFFAWCWSDLRAHNVLHFHNIKTQKE